MPRLSRISGTVLAAWLWLCGLGTQLVGGAEDHTFFHENVMGTSLELRVRADTPEAARWAEDRVLGAIDRLAAIFSGYDPASEFRRWQATFPGHGPAPTPVSPELFVVLRE